MFKVLVIGYSGQLASSLREVMKEAVFASRSGPLNFDLMKTETILDRLNSIDPDVIVNAAGMTAVDMCEIEKREAYLINGISVREICRYSRKRGVRYIHISTDFVFDGNDGNYKEDSIPNPVNFYGMSKLIGDTFALSCDDSLVIRTSGVFGSSKNFPRYVVEKLRRGESVTAVKGFYSPIFSGLLAKAINEIVFSEQKGILNIAGERISRKDFALKIADKFGLRKELINENESVAKFVARRPFDSSLDISIGKKILHFDFFSTDANINEFFKFLESNSF
ncbi:MAG: NAD(P)-dependent oxidoreductase [Candidatus Parvarchaeota archaeon]